MFWYEKIDFGDGNPGFMILCEESESSQAIVKQYYTREFNNDLSSAEKHTERMTDRLNMAAYRWALIEYSKDEHQRKTNG